MFAYEAQDRIMSVLGKSGALRRLPHAFLGGSRMPLTRDEGTRGVRKRVAALRKVG